MSTSASGGWDGELERWLAPFLAALNREAQRRWAAVYLKGLLLPGERKSVEPMAARVAPGSAEQLHHFLGGSPWATGPLEAVLTTEADRLVGGPDALLVVDDTALPKQGKHSVGVARQYCGALGERANCQVLVSLTLARGESRYPWACGCSCRRGGRTTRSAAPGPACPRSTAARWRRPRSRSGRSTGSSPPASASAGW